MSYAGRTFRKAMRRVSEMRLVPLKLTLIYVASGLVWITLSDQITHYLAQDAWWLTWFQTANGGMFVVATGVFLYGLTRWYMRRLRQAQDQSWQMQKLEILGRMSASVAHDFNNVLTAIHGFASIAAETLGPAHPARKDVGEVLNAGRRGRNLVQQLMAFARQESAAPRLLRLQEVVDGCAPMLQRVLGRRVTLAIHAAPEAGPILADATRLEQILMNLAANAVDAMPEGGSLSIDIRDQGGGVVLAVRDTGVGMDEATLSRLFEPFFTTKPPGKGTGLGLATVYGIVQQYGGAIRVESRPGSGTAFLISFPRVADPDSGRGPIPAAPEDASVAACASPLPPIGAAAGRDTRACNAMDRMV